MIRKLVTGGVAVGLGLVALVGAERPAASQTPDDIIYFVGDQGRDCYVILSRGNTQGVSVGDRREVIGTITAEVVEVYMVRSKARVANAKCADVLTAYKAAREPKKAPTAEDRAKEQAKKCEAEKDRLASVEDPKDRSRFRYVVYKAGTKAPAKCAGETTIKVDGKDCGYRYCTPPAPSLR